MLVFSIALYTLIFGFLWGFHTLSDDTPDTISQIYYQMNDKYNKEFTILMATEAVGMSILAITCSVGLWWLGVIGCLGLLMVGLIPCYLHCDKCLWLHKLGAFVAAGGCVAWCISVNPLVTMYVCILYATHLIASGRTKAWYVAEICAFIDFFLTYWIQ